MNESELKNYFAHLSYPADIAEYLEQVDLSEWPKLLRLIEDPEKRAEVVAGINETKLRDLLTKFKPLEIAEIIREMESDDATDIIAKLPLSLRYETLCRLPEQQRHQTLELLGYPEDSAGGIMQIELAHIQEDSSVADAIVKVRELVEDDVQVLIIWVVDTSNRLIGSVELSDLLIHKSTTNIKNLIKTDIICVKPLVDQKEVAQLFKKYDLLTLPVIDDEGYLLGRISVDDIVDVLTEEADEEALRMVGINVEELTTHQERMISIARTRIPWLAISLICSLISATILQLFQHMIEKMTIIYAFIPVVTAMAGNVGSQSSTILIRGFATGKTNFTDIPKLLIKEIKIGLIMGAFYGICAALITTLVLTDRNNFLGCTVLTAMTAAIVTAGALGVLAPTILHRFKADPAIAAGPFVTAFNDITGVLIFIITAECFWGIF